MGRGSSCELSVILAKSLALTKDILGLFSFSRGSMQLCLWKVMLILCAVKLLQT